MGRTEVTIGIPRIGKIPLGGNKDGNEVEKDVTTVAAMVVTTEAIGGRTAVGPQGNGPTKLSKTYKMAKRGTLVTELVQSLMSLWIVLMQFDVRSKPTAKRWREKELKRRPHRNGRS